LVGRYLSGLSPRSDVRQVGGGGDATQRLGYACRIRAHSADNGVWVPHWLPGVRITAIPEGQEVQVLDGSHKLSFDLRRPCSKRQVACTIYQ
jgi:hypothetical protein